ncbi:chromophore lyase CRL, chloroplastic isoform X3 [Aegilops tauschii subsp. strangulata]|uniref:chromophore lyase CRL, chloroplastic isoform X3 n=1 Tax=Aegilops tauschii subsp. strangulata TaxID=200361 RepID=UPI00098A7244|nr:chromophore lyase CRL, chloroplastic isoform X3 [Aegilops tauschii subsp. strangulata]
MGSGEDTPEGTGGGVGGIVRGALLKALVVFGGVILIRRLRRSTTRWDHARAVADALSGEKRFYMVKPCPKEMKCDVELSSYAIRDVEEYKNFCDRQKDQRPQPEEVIADIAEHLTTIHLSRCERGKRCLYEGSTPLGGFPNSWGGAAYCTSDLSIHKNGETHIWDKGFDDNGSQVWGTKAGPYEFKPAPKSNYDDMFSPLNFSAPLSLEKMESSYAIDDQ